MRCRRTAFSESVDEVFVSLNYNPVKASCSAKKNTFKIWMEPVVWYFQSASVPYGRSRFNIKKKNAMLRSYQSSSSFLPNSIA